MTSKEYFWYIVHNVVAHPLLILRVSWTETFHDWTAEKMAEAGGRL